MNTKTKKLYNRAQELAQQLDDDYSYHNGGTQYYSVDVKQYNSFVDVTELIAKQAKKYQSDLTEYFTDDTTYELANNWLEFECEYVIDCITNIVHIDTTEPDYKQWRIVADLASNVYFLGRSGGHLCLDGLPDYTELIDDCENTDDLKYYIEQMQAIIFVLDWCKKYSDRLDFTDELEFRIDEYIADELEPMYQARAEIKQAKKLAKKYGYILAQEVKQ